MQWHAEPTDDGLNPVMPRLDELLPIQGLGGRHPFPALIQAECLLPALAAEPHQLLLEDSQTTGVDARLLLDDAEVTHTLAIEGGVEQFPRLPQPMDGAAYSTMLKPTGPSPKPLMWNTSPAARSTLPMAPFHTS